MNFKNATNVSAADSVARGASIYMEPRAKLGDRREREAEAGRERSIEFSLGEKKSSNFVVESYGVRRRDGATRGDRASRIGVKYWTASPDTNQRRELARITGASAVGEEAVIRSEA